MKKQNLLGVCLLAAALALSACGGQKDAGTEKSAETAAAAEESAEEKTEAAQEEKQDDSKEKTAGEKKKAEKSDEIDSADAGKYLIYEYTGNGTTVSYDMLKTAGMGDTYLELAPDGTGTLFLYQTAADITWKPGEVTIYGSSKYTYTIEGDTLYLDMQGVQYTMKRDGSAGVPETKTAKAEETKDTEPAAEETTEAAAGTEASKELAGPPPKGEVGKMEARGGDGIVTEEEVMKGYVYLSKINSANAFSMSYDELKDYFGVPGKFTGEEYSEHMKCYYCYFDWIASENPNLFIHVNFKEDDAGNYHISGYNSSGFTGSQAEEKYLAQMQEEAKEADKAKAASAPKKKETLEVFKFGDHDNPLKVDVEIPQSGWSIDTKGSGVKLVDSDDPGTFGAGFIKFERKDKVEDFDFYKDKFENYKELGTREIDGVTFQARSYKNIGYDWIEFIAQLNDDVALSIGTVRVDVDEGTTGDMILKSIKFQ